MKEVVLCLVLVLASASAGPGVDWQAVLLPESASKDLRSLCSRPGPKVDGSWKAGPADVAGLESHLDELYKMSSTGEDFFKGFRQYIAIVVAGRKYIYINGFPFSVAEKTWMTTMVSVCDGGPAFWGVLYDIEKGTFSDLKFNGVA